MYGISTSLYGDVVFDCKSKCLLNSYLRRLFELPESMESVRSVLVEIYSFLLGSCKVEITPGVVLHIQNTTTVVLSRYVNIRVLYVLNKLTNHTYRLVIRTR